MKKKDKLDGRQGTSEGLSSISAPHKTPIPDSPIISELIIIVKFHIIIVIFHERLLL